MIKESIIVIANRHADQITREINVFLSQLEDNLADMVFGFRFHNLACPCEGMIKYWGESLAKLGFEGQLNRIKKIGKAARMFQDIFDEGRQNDRKDELVSAIRLFSEALKENLPVLFFIV